MNTELRGLVVGAEGRYLSDAEMARFREFAINMTGRIETARKLQHREPLVVTEALRLLTERVPDVAKQTGQLPRARSFLEHTLRYAALAHVRSDPEFFRRAYAEWSREQLRAALPDATVTACVECLQRALDEQLDPVDARAVGRFVDVFMETLRGS
jgi:predicted nucleic acid-binding protein